MVAQLRGASFRQVTDDDRDDEENGFPGDRLPDDDSVDAADSAMIDVAEALGFQGLNRTTEYLAALDVEGKDILKRFKALQTGRPDVIPSPP